MVSLFQNSQTPPDGATICAALQSDPQVWERLMVLLNDAGVAVSWRYYRDGGWLARAMAGSKTIAWLAVEEGFVRVTFYFAERHRDQLRRLTDLPVEIRDRIAQTALSGKLLPVTFEVHKIVDIAPVASVLEHKLTAR